MATKPSELPRWADGGSGTPTNTAEPLESRKDSGYLPGEPLPAQALNWFWNLAYQWLAWLDQQTTAPTIHYVGDAGEPVYQNGWAETSAGRRAHFYKDLSGVVHVGGLVGGGAAGTIFQLPAGYAPSGLVFKPARGTTTATRIDITVTSSGDVQAMASGAGLSVYLDEITFMPGVDLAP